MSIAGRIAARERPTAQFVLDERDEGRAWAFPPSATLSIPVEGDPAPWHPTDVVELVIGSNPRGESHAVLLRVREASTGAEDDPRGADAVRILLPTGGAFCRRRLPDGLRCFLVVERIG